MPRLPVSRDERDPGQPKLPTMRIGGFALLVAAALFVAWLAGVGILARSLLVDVGCLDTRMPWRGEIGEMVACSLAAGPRGWLFLLYCASYPAWSLTRLRARYRMMLAEHRRGAGPAGDDG